MTVEVVLFVCGINWKTGEIFTVSQGLDKFEWLKERLVEHGRKIDGILNNLSKQVTNLSHDYIGNPILVNNVINNDVLGLVYCSLIPVDTILKDAKWYSMSDVYQSVHDSKELGHIVQSVYNKVKNSV